MTFSFFRKQINGRALALGTLLLAAFLGSNNLTADNNDLAIDPGVRAGPPGAGGPLPGLTANEIQIFNEAKLRVQELEATCVGCSDFPEGQPAPPGFTNSAGLGGRFNSDQCMNCHSFPAVGGTSPRKNPLFEVATRKGAQNRMFSFLTPDGPTREVRQKYNADGSRHGGVVNLFTLTGRVDAPNCHILQPDLETEFRRGNLSFRIPLQLFGLGFIDSIPDQVIIDNMNANRNRKAALGITGHPNRSANDGTITRLGWKAQNKSSMVFAGEAYNVEMGVTNELFPTAREETPGCTFGEPGDGMRTDDPNFNSPVNVHADWVMFGMFSRSLDGPAPAPLSSSAFRGKQVFSDVGCALCHTPSMTVRSGDAGPLVKALSGKTANLYSDLIVHRMGATLADDIMQGNAGPDEFRTTPLWGIGQRIFFLHDGRTKDIQQAILLHASASTPQYPASEANAVIRNYLSLNKQDKQAILDFLRSL